jgi:hypothetical protein
MKPKLEEVVITSYITGVPEPRPILAYVFGDWMAHQPLDGDTELIREGFKWVVTHRPTSALAYVARKVESAREACRRLNEIVQPDSHVAIREDGSHYMTRPSLEYIKASCDACAGLEIWAILGTRYIPVDEVFELARSRIKPWHNPEED